MTAEMPELDEVDVSCQYMSPGYAWNSAEEMCTNEKKSANPIQASAWLQIISEKDGK